LDFAVFGVNTKTCLQYLYIWRDFNVLSYIACPRYPYIRVYRLYNDCEGQYNTQAYLNCYS